MTDYLQMKIDNNKSYIRILRRTFRHSVFAIIITAVLGVICYLLNNMYCVGIMVTASIYIIFFMVEHVIEIKHHQKLLEIYESVDWKKDILDAQEIYNKQAQQYELLIRRQEAKDNQ